VREVGHASGSGALLLWLLIFPMTVAAQTAPPPSPPPAAARVEPPQVSDPMLAPPARAPREIASWEQALRMVRAQAPDYLASHQRVRQAEARSRIALGRALPVLDGEGTFTHQLFTEDRMVGGEVVETLGEWERPLDGTANHALYRAFQAYLARR